MRFVSARQAWEAVYKRSSPQGLLRVPGSTAYDSSDAAWNAVEMGKVQAAIASLSPLHRSWGMRLCTAEFTERDEKTVREHAFGTLLARHGNAMRSHSHILRLGALVFVAVEDAVLREWCGKAAFSDAELARRIQAKPQNWNRDWEPTYLTLLDAILDLTSATLGPVARVVDEMRSRSAA